MTTVRYLYTQTPKGRSIFLMVGSEIRTVSSSNAKFKTLLEYLKSTSESDVDGSEVLRLVDSGKEVQKSIQRLSERISYHDGVLMFDGDVLDNAISRHISRMIETGDEAYHNFIQFLENLALNPSGRARRELFNWVNVANLTITSDGRFLAYKGVQNVPDNLSISRGVEKVWVDGVEHVGNIPNPIGAIVNMARSEVDDDKDVACSKGLHAGTHGYAVGFGHKLLLVAINPRDVVSVPRDASFQKLRVCRYEVLALGDGQIEDTSYSGSHRYDAPVEPEVKYLCDNCREEEVDAQGEHCSECQVPDLCDNCGEVEVDTPDEVCDNCQQAQEEANEEKCDICGEFDCDR